MVLSHSEDLLYEITQSKLISLDNNHGSTNVKNLKMTTFLLMRAQKPLQITTLTMKEINRQFFMQTIKFIYFFNIIFRSAMFFKYR